MRAHAVEPNPNLYIHNVPKDATEEEINSLFSSFGNVERIKLKINQKIGPQALYAFVTYSTVDEAQNALQKLNGYEIRSRRLRIEFQKCRDDNDEHHRHMSKDNPQSHEFRRKRDKEDQNFSSRASDAKSGMAYEQNAESNSMNKRLKQKANEQSYAYSNTYENKYYDMQEENESLTIEPVVIYLYKLLKVARPDLYNKPIDHIQHPKEAYMTNINSTHVSQPSSNIYPQEAFISSSTGVKLDTKLDDKTAVNIVDPGTVIWSGPLTRNSRKKVDVDLVYFYGEPIGYYLINGLQKLNISHRSSWDDLLKKNIISTCALKLPEGALKTEESQSLFTEHVTYLAKKERAGVVALEENVYMYLIPPKSPLFDKFKGDAIKSNGEYLIALIVLNNTSQNVGNIPPPPPPELYETTNEPPQPTALLDLLNNLVPTANT